MGNLHISNNAQKLTQSPIGMPGVRHAQPNLPPQGSLGNIHSGSIAGQANSHQQQPPITQYAPRMATSINLPSPSTGVRPNNPQQFPGPMSHPQGAMNGIGLSWFVINSGANINYKQNCFCTAYTVGS